MKNSPSLLGLTMLVGSQASAAVLGARVRPVVMVPHGVVAPSLSQTAPLLSGAPGLQAPRLATPSLSPAPLPAPAPLPIALMPTSAPGTAATAQAHPRSVSAAQAAPLLEASPLESPRSATRLLAERAGALDATRPQAPEDDWWDGRRVHDGAAGKPLIPAAGLAGPAPHARLAAAHEGRPAPALGAAGRLSPEERRAARVVTRGAALVAPLAGAYFVLEHLGVSFTGVVFLLLASWVAALAAAYVPGTLAGIALGRLRHGQRIPLLTPWDCAKYGAAAAAWLLPALPPLSMGLDLLDRGVILGALLALNLLSRTMPTYKAFRPLPDAGLFAAFSGLALSLAALLPSAAELGAPVWALIGPASAFVYAAFLGWALLDDSHNVRAVGGLYFMGHPVGETYEVGTTYDGKVLQPPPRAL